jgi:hypothetical protein
MPFTGSIICTFIILGVNVKKIKIHARKNDEFTEN